MKKIFAIGLFALLSSSAIAQVHVNGYYRKNGTYVQPHMRSSPDNTTLNNYSTKGNINPYTGQAGTKEPEPYGYQRPQQTQDPEPYQQRRQQQQGQDQQRSSGYNKPGCLPQYPATCAE